MTEQVVPGIIASEGVAIGPLAILQAAESVARTAGTPEEESQSLKDAIERSKESISKLMDGADELVAEILEFQFEMMDDEEFVSPVFEAISAGTSADQAWENQCNSEAAEYAESGSEYLAARADDLNDIKSRVVRALSGEEAETQKFAEGAIIVADDLTPSSFLAFNWPALGGAIVRGGSPTSHVSILARARGVPMLVGTTGISSEAESCILDASAGKVILDPSEASISQARNDQAGIREKDQAAAKIVGNHATTHSGTRVETLINVDDPAMLDDIPVGNCDGIGLFRTEFLIEGASVPDEEAQFKIYDKVLRWAEGRPVTIRTFDAGGDKPVPGMSMETETNPFLGLRGLRLSLTMPDVFKTQLRALVRANTDGNLKIMVPMVTLPDEMDQAISLLDEVCSGLVDCNRPALGMMIEVPAAALCAEDFNTDFYSIGSNDLVQYTMASARDNPLVAHLAKADSPAVLALIKQTIDAAATKGVSVSLCGDMASNERFSGALLSAGLRTFSVSPALLGRIKLSISQTSDDGVIYG